MKINYQILFYSLFYIAACSDSNFNEQGAEVKEVAPPAILEGDANSVDSKGIISTGGDEVIREIAIEDLTPRFVKHDHEEVTRTINTFDMGSFESKTIEIEIPREPYSYITLEQTPSSDQYSFSIQKSELRTDKLTKSAPIEKESIFLPHDYSQTQGDESPLDIYVVIDNSDGIVGNINDGLGNYKEDNFPNRIREVLDKLSSDLSNRGFKWQMSLRGLSNAGQELGVTESNYQKKVTSFLTNQFNNKQGGDEPVLYSLAKLYESTASRRDIKRPQIFLIISEGANCKTDKGTYIGSGDCKSFKSRVDYWKNEGEFFDGWQVQNAIFASVYKQSNDSSKPVFCQAGEPLEVDAPGESLIGKSQYADIAAHWEEAVHGKSNINTGDLRYTADLCAAESGSLSFSVNIDSLVENIGSQSQFLANTRFVSDSPWDTFVSSDDEYNIDVMGFSLGTDYTLYDNRLVAFKKEKTSPVDIIAYLKNDYDQTEFKGVVKATPDGVVNLTGNGYEIECQNASDFSKNSSLECRYSGKDLYLKDYRQPEIPQSGGASYTLEYQTKVDQKLCADDSTKSCVIIETKYLIDLESILFSKGADLIGSLSYTPIQEESGGKHYTILKFSGVLPFGDYEITYSDQIDYFQRFDMKSQRVSGSAVHCYKIGAKGSVDSGGNLVIDDPKSEITCTFDKKKQQVSIASIIEKNAQGKRLFNVGFEANIDPISSFQFEVQPDYATIKAEFWANYVDAADSSQVLVIDEDYSLGPKGLTLKNALQPGQKIKIDYNSAVFWNDCHILSGKAAEEYGYNVFYLLEDEEREMDPQEYELSEVADEVQICVKDESSAPKGGFLRVEFVEQHSLTTDIVE